MRGIGGTSLVSKQRRTMSSQLLAGRSRLDTAKTTLVGALSAGPPWSTQKGLGQLRNNWRAGNDVGCCICHRRTGRRGFGPELRRGAAPGPSRVWWWTWPGCCTAGGHALAAKLLAAADQQPRFAADW